MFDVILKLADKAIELVKLREKNKREFFEIIIDPLFEEFEKVSKSYFLLLQTPKLQKTELEKIRNEYLQTRIKITELVCEYKKTVKDEEINKFFDSIYNFFFEEEPLSVLAPKSWGHYYYNLVNEQNNRKNDENFDKLLTRATDELYERLQTSWGESVKLYGSLKMKYKLPIGKNI